MERRRSPGLILTFVGVGLVLLGIFAPDLPFAPRNLFLPIMLIFFGRAMSRQAKKGDKNAGQPGRRPVPTVPRTVQSEPVGGGSRPATNQPVGALEDKLREALMLPPVTAPPARRQAPAKTHPAPEVVVTPPAEQLPVPPAEPVPEPRPAASGLRSQPARSRRGAQPEAPDPAVIHQAAVYPRTGRVARMPTVFPAPHAARKTKSSQEMVAEAKERLKKPRS